MSRVERAQKLYDKQQAEICLALGPRAWRREEQGGDREEEGGEEHWNRRGKPHRWHRPHTSVMVCSRLVYLEMSARCGGYALFSFIL